MIRTALLTLCLAAPAMAQDYTMVSFMARDLDDSDPVKAYRAATAACLMGQGDPAATAALFTDAGWAMTEEIDAGLNQFAAPDPNLYVLAASDGSFCAAYSEALGTDSALGNVQIIGGAGGFAFDNAASPLNCIAFQLAADLLVEVTSSGNDPVCSDAATSSVRFTFGPGQ